MGKSITLFSFGTFQGARSRRNPRSQPSELSRPFSIPSAPNRPSLCAFGGETMAFNPLSRAIQVVQGRWFTVFASFLINATSGSLFVFAIYSKDIRSALGYDQRTLNTVSFFKDLGASVGILSGLIYEVAPPWAVLAFGSVMNLFGYLMIYLAITGRLARPRVWEMCLYICIGANSQTFSNTGVVVTCLKNFPGSRGVVLGLLKGFAGLSGAIFAQLYLAIYGDDSRSLVLLIAWLPATITVIFLCTIRILKTAHQPGETTKPFYYFLYISIALAAYLMVMIVVQKRVAFTCNAYRINAAVVVLLLVLPLAVVIREELKIFKPREQLLQNSPLLTVAVDARTMPQPPPPPTAAPSTISMKRTLSYIINVFRAPERGEDHSILQALVSIDMVVLFIAMICGVGGTLTAIDNMGQIGESLGYSSQTISTFVSLISIWNFGGRVAAGFISDILLEKYKLPRPLVLTIVLLLSCAGHLLIAFGVPGSLYIASVIIGLCFGAEVPLFFAILSEVFGLKYYSTLYNILPMASPIGSYVLNVMVAGYFYDGEAAKQESLTCMGVRCYNFSFLIITAATVFGALVLLVLVRRTWDLYKRDIYARFREGSQGSNQGGEREEWTRNDFRRG
ncbi:protein NUCLEAR FUSION DEFECTIVE 4-like [Phoenix dactylifera]|uniref:Protein NUCLEAR FUSION DEFECTIVE 4-like n=1 Tax=Phoenix dactylifera TaxID=42345 RepID=A0A8B7D120_PHODC|nr:protein NUCLEAR FUSION DEFECTIVE 4-like [Phoenix dactylifera]